MKISKSKQELARVISENGGWSDGYSFSAQNCGDDWVDVWFFESKPARRHAAWFTDSDNCKCVISGVSKLSNWHQTIISRDEYFHLYPAPDADGWIEWRGGELPVKEGKIIDVKYGDGDELYGAPCGLDVDMTSRDGHLACAHVFGAESDIIAYRLHNPEYAETEYKDGVKPTDPAKVEQQSKPAIEQLAADYRNAKDFADRKQQEADAAKADAEAKLAELVAAGKAHGLALSVADAVSVEPEPEPVITDWRDLRVGDIVWVDAYYYHDEGEWPVNKMEGASYDCDYAFSVKNGVSCERWVSVRKPWRFIRRP